ncbi:MULTISPECIES: type II secretion system F family protein [Crateriforma]|uniref:Bacterial type II secretion system protein F domain protein n=1 Tax=Crateriforma conspicua TaxID=2527996 RepID=A0A5C6FQD7_9PLAN|nr:MULTISPECIES: type II secretion system F family protein [Crateriforma]QDV61938.1 Bacterial type II secretion system protein F domain protein [Crateriforma conspicua]TWT71813.1 Bacterial type II secretion system protein F domain protein [Crateriforma conspicua]TWU62683.1 Bacterial type II secretion system protein F domain protein [Crateriforma conspicua]
MLTPMMLASSTMPIILTCVAAFVGVTAVAWLVLGRVSGDDRPTAESRLDILKDPRKTRSQSEGDDKRKKKNEALTAALEKASSPIGDKIAGNEAEMGKLREKMVNAGFRHESAPLIFKFIQLVFSASGLLVGGVTGLVMNGVNSDMIMKLAIGVIIGFGLPNFILNFLANRRKQSIFLGLPDALDLMVVCVEAGLGMDQTLRKVAEEMKKSHKNIGEEFAIANQQLQFGRPRNEVLAALGYRSGVDDLKQLANILIQADKFGSSVSQALRVQSDSMRTKRRQIAEEKAAKTAVKMIFPLVLFIFPGIFVILVGPAAINMSRQMLGN